MTVRHYAAIARRYAEAVVGGDIAACQWVQLACQRQLDDSARFKRKHSLSRFTNTLFQELIWPLVHQAREISGLRVATARRQVAFNHGSQRGK